jgi:3-hydroxyacyl-CoA dehydrogenase
MAAEGMAVPAKVTQMLADGGESFYRRENGQVSYWDFGSGKYVPVVPNANIISLAGLKGAGAVVDGNASATLVDLGDGVFCCEFHTKMNALNGEILDFMGQALDHVDGNGVGLVIGNQAGGMPGAFSAGADLKFVSGLVAQGKFDEIDAFINKGQQAMQRARYAPFPVVAAPYGMALGGGCEVCLGADRIVAHSELYMGLVEIGVGLLPAGGGCLNLWKKMVGTLPAAVKDADLAKFFIPTFMAIAMAKVSMSAAQARANGFLGPCDRIVFNRDYLIGEAKKEVLQMVAAGYTAPTRLPVPVVGQAAAGMINAEIHNMQSGGFVSEYDAFLARRIAHVISGGETRTAGKVDEQVILNLEREAFVDFLKEEKTQARVEHMLKTGKPLRN